MRKLILLHGALGASSQFDGLYDKLDGNYNISRFDFSDHGRNNISANELSIEFFSDELQSFILNNQITDYDIFGYSMGGYIALYHAYLYPNPNCRIFTLATKFDWNPTSSILESKNLDPEKIIEKVPAYASELMRLHGDKWTELMIKTVSLMIRLGDNPTLNDTILAEIRNRVYLTVGDRDKMVGIDETVKAYKLLPNAQLSVLPNTIHPISRIDLSRIVHEIRTFFD